MRQIDLRAIDDAGFLLSPRNSKSNDMVSIIRVIQCQLSHLQLNA
jgi:hypothetical protein